MFRNNCRYHFRCDKLIGICRLVYDKVHQDVFCTKSPAADLMGSDFKTTLYAFLFKSLLEGLKDFTSAGRHPSRTVADADDYLWLSIVVFHKSDP